MTTATPLLHGIKVLEIATGDFSGRVAAELPCERKPQRGLCLGMDSAQRAAGQLSRRTCRRTPPRLLS